MLAPDRTAARRIGLHGQQRFQPHGRLLQPPADFLQRDLAPHVALFGQHVLLDDPQDVIDHDPPQPGDEFAGRLAAELVEIAMGLEKRLLHDVRRADPDPQPVIELGGHQQLQVVRIEGQQPPQAELEPSRADVNSLSTSLCACTVMPYTCPLPSIMGRRPVFLSRQKWQIRFFRPNLTEWRRWELPTIRRSLGRCAALDENWWAVPTLRGRRDRRPARRVAGGKRLLRGLVDDVLRFGEREWLDSSGRFRVPHLGESSLFSAAARSLSAVSIDGDHAEVESQPATAERPCHPARATIAKQSPRPRRLNSGASASIVAANFAGSDSVTSARPYRHADEDFPCRAIGIHRYEWQSAANAEPGVLGPVIAFELTVSSNCRSASVPGIPWLHKSRL